MLTPMFCGSAVSYAPVQLDLRYTYLHEGSIAEADGGVCERVRLAEISASTALLVVDTKDHEALVGHRVNEVLALDDNRVGGGDRRRERAESGEVACELGNSQLYSSRG